jgi:signal recognition particle receptor subunit beta
MSLVEVWRIVTMKWESNYLYGLLGAVVLVSCYALTESDEAIVSITSTAHQMRINGVIFIAEFMLALVCVYRLSRSK